MWAQICAGVGRGCGMGRAAGARCVRVCVGYVMLHVGACDRWARDLGGARVGAGGADIYLELEAGRVGQRERSV